MPPLTSSSTLCFGSFATSSPFTSIAKIFPFNVRTLSELNILFRVTCRSSAKAAATGANLGSISGASGPFFVFFAVLFITRPYRARVAPCTNPWSRPKMPVQPWRCSLHPDGLHPGSCLAIVVGDDDPVPARDINILAVAAGGDRHSARLLGDVELVLEALLDLLRPERPGEQCQNNQQETDGNCHAQTAKRHLEDHALAHGSPPFLGIDRCDNPGTGVYQNAERSRRRRRHRSDHQIVDVERATLRACRGGVVHADVDRAP